MEEIRSSGAEDAYIESEGTNQEDQYPDDFDDIDDFCLEEHETLQEEETNHGISVYKSNIGPSLTVQPRRKTYSEISIHQESRTHTRSLKKRPLVTEKVKQPHNGRRNSSVRDPLNDFKLRGDHHEDATISAGEFSDITKIIEKGTSNNNNNNKPKVKNVRNNFMTRRYGVISRSGFQRRPTPLKVVAAKGTGNNISQRVASAKRLNMSDMKNHIRFLQLKIEELQKENRTMHILQKRQEKAIKKFDGQEAELPQLMRRHKEELRNLQEQLRRVTMQCRDREERLRLRDGKIIRLETEMSRLQSLIENNDLEERAKLQEELEITHMNLQGAEKRIQEYMRHVEVLEKNHRHQLATEERKLIKANGNLYSCQAEISRLKQALRDKDRMLNYIQMRSSGRNLIRSYQAESIGTSTDDFFSKSPNKNMGAGITNFSQQQHPRQKTYVKEKIVTAQSSCTKLYSSHPEPVLRKHNTELTKNPSDDEDEFEDENPLENTTYNISNVCDARNKQYVDDINTNKNLRRSSNKKQTHQSDFATQISQRSTNNNKVNYPAPQKRSLDSIQKSRQPKNADAILGTKPRYKSTIAQTNNNNKGTPKVQTNSSVPMYINAHQKMLARRLSKAGATTNLNPSYANVDENEHSTNNHNTTTNNVKKSTGPNKNYSITDLVKNIAKINDYQKQREEEEKEQMEQLKESTRALVQTETLEDQLPPCKQWGGDDDYENDGNSNRGRNKVGHQIKPDHFVSNDRISDDCYDECEENTQNNNSLPFPPPIFTDSKYSLLNNNASGDGFQNPGVLHRYHDESHNKKFEETTKTSSGRQERNEFHIQNSPKGTPVVLSNQSTDNSEKSNFPNPIQQVYAFYTQHEPNCPAACSGRSNNNSPRGNSNYYFYGPASSTSHNNCGANNLRGNMSARNKSSVAVKGSPEAASILMSNTPSLPSTTSFPQYSYPQGNLSPRRNDFQECQSPSRTMYLPPGNNTACSEGHHSANNKPPTQKGNSGYDPTFFENLGSWT